MKTWLIGLSIALFGVVLNAIPLEAEAKRLGGGRASGMQRQAQPTKPADNTAASPTQNQAGAAAAQPGRRSWMGPLAGLAAGLGIAALLSHFGLGEGFSNIVTMLLLAAVAVFVIRWLMRRFAGGQQRPAMAGANNPFKTGAPGAFGQNSAFQPLQPTGAGATGAGAGAPGTPMTPSFNPSFGGSTQLLPPGVDTDEFKRIAKMIFIRMQAANDAGSVEDLRKFTTPELFASLRLDLQERGAAPQHTDVVQVDVDLLGAVQEGDQWIVSVRFYGIINEDPAVGPQPFDESWHLVKPVSGDREWAIAGITPNA